MKFLDLPSFWEDKSFGSPRWSGRLTHVWPSAFWCSFGGWRWCCTQDQPKERQGLFSRGKAGGWSNSWWVMVMMGLQLVCELVMLYSLGDSIHSRVPKSNNWELRPVTSASTCPWATGSYWPRLKVAKGRWRNRFFDENGFMRSSWVGLNAEWMPKRKAWYVFQDGPSGEANVKIKKQWHIWVRTTSLICMIIFICWT